MASAQHKPIMGSRGFGQWPHVSTPGAKQLYEHSILHIDVINVMKKI